MPIHTLRTDDSQRPPLLFNLPYPPDDHEQLPEGISLCMIVKNEERFLEACLRSVEGIVDEINIVDTGSTDRTLEIAAKFGARIEHREWRNDFAWARNEALAMATKRWVLVLDGDEEIAPESRRQLLDLRTQPAYLTVVYVRIHNDTTEYGASSMMSHSLPRIFPTTPRIRYTGVIHEMLTADEGRTQSTAVITPIRILHRGYTTDVIGSKKKNERNAPLLERATQINENDSFAWFNYANYLIGSNRNDEGIECMQRVVDMERGKDMRGYVPLAYTFLAGTVASHLGDFDRAHTIIDECLERLPKYVLALYGKAEIYARASRYDDAREWFQKAIATRAHEEWYNVVDEEIVVWKSQSNIATSYVNEGKYDEAITWLEEAHRNKPDILVIKERLAWLYEKTKRYFDAEFILREAFDKYPDERSVVLYVNYLARRNRFTRALEVIEESLPSAAPELKASLNTAAGAIMRKTGAGDPVPYLRAALEISPGAGLALELLDKIYLELNDEISRARLRRDEMDAPLVNPTDFLRRSSRLLEDERYEDAARAAEDGLIRDPGNASLLTNLALALSKTPQGISRAIDLLDTVRIGDGDVVQHAGALRADLLEREGRLEEALATLERAFGEFPANEDILLQRSRLLQQMGQNDAAEKGLRAAMVRGNKRIGLELAALMLREGRFNDAQTVAQEALASA
ncbi:MAG TPA: tetratricopeptide repeat protein [Candidatus Acidoferrales bacterium]|nr:tetratricopeptide repeat protein [Candidatus Acidoferrales bacterium]